MSFVLGFELAGHEFRNGLMVVCSFARAGAEVQREVDRHGASVSNTVILSLKCLEPTYGPAAGSGCRSPHRKMSL